MKRPILNDGPLNKFPRALWESKRVWFQYDKYPEIISGDSGGSAYLQDLYYPLKDANNGVITEAEILSHVKGIDNEDGATLVTLEDFNAEEFKTLTSDAKILVTYRTTDSCGNFVTSSI